MRGAVFAGTFLLLLKARERAFNESPAAGFRDLINSGFVYWRFVIFSPSDSSPRCPKLFTRLINVVKNCFISILITYLRIHSYVNERVIADA